MGEEEQVIKDKIETATEYISNSTSLFKYIGEDENFYSTKSDLLSAQPANFQQAVQRMATGLENQRRDINEMQILKTKFNDTLLQVNREKNEIDETLALALDRLAKAQSTFNAKRVKNLEQGAEKFKRIASEFQTHLGVSQLLEQGHVVQLPIEEAENLVIEKKESINEAYDLIENAEKNEEKELNLLENYYGFSNFEEKGLNYLQRKLAEQVKDVTFLERTKDR